MNPRQESWMLAALCLVVMLLSLAGLVWDFAIGLMRTLDGLLLLLTCLVLGGVFSLQLFQLVRAEGWLKRLPWLRSKSAPADSSAKSAKE